MTLPTSTSRHALVKGWLTAAGVLAVDGPAKNLPTAPSGLVVQVAVLYPSAPLHQRTRMTGTRSGRSDRVTIQCVGPTARDALAVADKVDAALDGKRLSEKGGPLAQTLATQPVPEPNADPVRVFLTVEYTAITKG